MRKSVTPDYLVRLKDGAKRKMLKQHPRTALGLTPEQDRAKWPPPPDHPMVAPDHAIRRSELAKEFGLGRSRAPASGKARKRAWHSGQERGPRVAAGRFRPPSAGRGLPW